MLLLHQSGSVRVGEIVRYKVTYIPSLDRILPPPTHLHIKIKNTSAIPLRAAYLHGPYTLYVAAYPSTYDPNTKYEKQEEHGGPDYEPQLKAGGHWSAKLKVPDEIREDTQNIVSRKEQNAKRVTWIIEIASQVLFSKTAAVHYELLVARDEKSIASRLTGVISMTTDNGMPGKLEDLQESRKIVSATEQKQGVFSKAVKVVVEDTESLWNEPPFPSWKSDPSGNMPSNPTSGGNDGASAINSASAKSRKVKKVHLVVLTHGLHSNLGADMLYMKESIDATAKQAKLDAKRRRAELRTKGAEARSQPDQAGHKLPSDAAPPDVPTNHDNDDSGDDEDDEDEEIMVRGFNGNAVRTERGIQYLGKRLAKFVLSITYPDQPYLPTRSSISKTITRTLTGQKPEDDKNHHPAHRHSSIIKEDKRPARELPYHIVSISFISHSLGGLVQTYAIAYIQKHSPEFFDRIKPINFVAMAAPFLGLSNENPMYVKFALDFGLVGRTGQDLGLTWRAPTLARSGWGAVVNGLVNDPHKDRQPDPGAKPLLRILPTGPAHAALKKFRNRTVYSNVVNDGIVPLRTSCLLFLDWRGLDRVEKARRESGLIGTMVNWGWNEMLGHNATTPRRPLDFLSEHTDSSSVASDEGSSTVPLPEATQDIDNQPSSTHVESDGRAARAFSQGSTLTSTSKEDASEQGSNAWYAFLNYFKPQAGSKPRKDQSKRQKIYSRGQTMNFDDEEPEATSSQQAKDKDKKLARRGPVRGSSLYTNNSDGDGLEAPPKTTVFESAGDLLNPPLPPREFILDPSARPRTIFHDRVYHPDDIPPPPAKRQKTFMGFNSSKTDVSDSTVPNQAHEDLLRISSSSKGEAPGAGSMKIEEKIARAYHKDMAWRKVLVRLEPDAHNNMIVRRMFANAYGWPVVKHMCDTHFAFTAAATTRDDDEAAEERAKGQGESAGDGGEEVRGQVKPPHSAKTSQHDDDTPRRRPTSPSSSDTMNGKPSSDDVPRPDKPNKIASNIRRGEPERTTSETRESQDRVSDLVSLVTATGQTGSWASNSYRTTSSTDGSASAALHRLARRDSARWSDRFFGGTDDESSDEEYGTTSALRQYADNNDLPSMVEGELAPPTANDGRQTAQAPILHGSNQVHKEPDVMAPEESIAAKFQSTRFSETRGSSIPITGLGTNVAGKVDGSPTDSQAEPSVGIVKQVAYAQSHDSSRR